MEGNASLKGTRFGGGVSPAFAERETAFPLLTMPETARRRSSRSDMQRNIRRYRMHHFRVMAGAMALLLLSAPASWAAAPQKAKAVPTAEPFEGVVIAEGLAAPWDMVWGPDNH